MPFSSFTIGLDRCIGCGLCVTTCAAEALSLMRKADPPYVPANLAEANIRLAMAGGKMGLTDMAGLVVRSKVDRLLARGGVGAEKTPSAC